MPKLIENIKECLILEGKKALLEKSYGELNIRELAKICDKCLSKRVKINKYVATICNRMEVFMKNSAIKATMPLNNLLLDIVASIFVS